MKQLYIDIQNATINESLKVTLISALDCIQYARHVLKNKIAYNRNGGE